MIKKNKLIFRRDYFYSRKSKESLTVEYFINIDSVKIGVNIISDSSTSHYVENYEKIIDELVKVNRLELVMSINYYGDLEYVQ